MMPVCAALVVVAGVFVLVLRRACVLLEVSGGSMRPAYRDSDRLLAVRLPVRLVRAGSPVTRVVRRGTVVAIRLKPVDGPSDATAPTCMIKRVAALPGEAVPVPDGGPGEGVVPAGHVYVLGDHRETSWDSRQEGPIPFSRVTGVVVCRVRHGNGAPPRVHDLSA